jgi:small subunit ribosomal protein S9|uniref:ribosomal protein S9 n=1 Tax=Fibrocapsa japonica TaxID=94617 RepID=UPI002113937C|nr:ribosomal protein S9 [Fibrocapsa japonica]UTE95136.1 ribosomal protein S9 [Fibrocapsa japonica]
MEQPKYQGVGRRKSSTANVCIKAGVGDVLVNNKYKENYFQYNENYLNTIKEPLQKLDLDTKYDIIIYVSGGGLAGQADAVRLALSRALCKMKLENRPFLKSLGFLRSDSRIKERRKYGLKKARKAPQFSKR